MLSGPAKSDLAQFIGLEYFLDGASELSCEDSPNVFEALSKQLSAVAPSNLQSRAAIDEPMVNIGQMRQYNPSSAELDALESSAYRLGNETELMGIEVCINHHRASSLK